MPGDVSIADIVGRYDPVNDDRAVLVRALVQREQGKADMLRLAAQQWGLHAEIVAEQLAIIGLGEPISPEERALIKARFDEHIAELLRQQNEGN